ncbi:Hypothetical protein RY67_1309 [Bifidobacterium longum subsp. infantis]|uniref:Uncharacterized protein n=1 Tax=Bifidobacterium longum subsp. infantis TaxID=1682 RepID=A0A0M4LUG4_BIFLI|nr:Hypothetical protein RY67_1309 [Bifidobacterium longum subsp. infantis]
MKRTRATGKCGYCDAVEILRMWISFGYPQQSAILRLGRMALDAINAEAE